MPVYIHQRPGWPTFIWNTERISPLLLSVRHRQGKLLGRMESLGFILQDESTLKNLTLEIVKSSEIEGEILDAEQVRSSIARKLGMDIAGLVPTDRYTEGLVEMMLDATQHYNQQLTNERLFGWQAALFPTGRSGLQKIVVGNWRDNEKDNPMQVVSGGMGKEKVHFEAPGAERLDVEMKLFLEWFNKETTVDVVLKAAIAHFWFVTIHPFDDGNGRIARTITDVQLSRADKTSQRFYSMSAQIRKERKEYYDILEKTQKGDLDITDWIIWFLNCMNRSLDVTDETLGATLQKARFWELQANTILNERQKLMLHKMLDGFDGKLNSSKWSKITKTSQDSALRDIQDLVNKKILQKETAGGRSTSYILLITERS